MTSPCHSPTNFEGTVKLPSNPKHELRILIPVIHDDYGETTCNIRQIRLIREYSCESYIEEVPLAPFYIFMHFGDFDNDKIIKEFRDDEIEFI